MKTHHFVKHTAALTLTRGVLAEPAFAATNLNKDVRYRSAGDSDNRSKATMKLFVALGVALFAGMVGTLTPSASAYALPIIHAGQICHARSDSNTANFRYSSVGIEARKSNAGDVICPVVIQKDVSGGLRVDVSVANSSPNVGTTSCSLASHSFTGNFRG